MRPGRRPLAALLCVALSALLAGCEPQQQQQPLPTPSGSPRAADVLHVNCGAPDGGDGTLQHPWNTLAAVNRHDAFLPGERIVLKRGTVCQGRLTPSGSGTNGDPIVLGAYGSGAAPVVHGGGTPDQTGAVQLTDQHDWVVQDLEVTNADPAGPDDTLRAGVLVMDDGSGELGRIVIRRNTVRRVTSSPAGASADPHEFGGITVLVRGTAARGAPLSDVRIEDNLVDHVGRTGIVAWSAAWPSSPLTSVSITGNHIVRPEGDSVIVWGVDGGVLEHNVSEQGGHLPACPRCSQAPGDPASAGIWPVMSAHVLVRYNEVSGEGAAGGDGEGFDIDDSTSDVVLEGNYAHDNDGGGVLICGARASDVRDNVFADSGGGEVTFSCPTQRDGVRIVDNTFVLAANSSAQVVRHNSTTGKEPVLFANNIVLDYDGGGYAWPMPVVAQGNLYSGVLPSSTPSDSTGVGDPGLVAPGTAGTGLDSVQGLAPSMGAAASSGGASVPDSGTTDYFGRSRVGALGRGAISASSVPAGLRPVTPVVTRSGSDVLLTWAAGTGSGWLLQRRTGSRAFQDITGTLTAGRYIDVAVPPGPVQYRLRQSGRDSVGAPSAVASG